MVCNQGDKHAYACSLLFHLLNDFWLHQDSGFPQEFSLFHVFDPGKILDSLKTFPFSFSRRTIKAKSTPWQVVSAPQRLTLEIQYGLPTYPQVEQGWDFLEVVLWHINLQIRWQRMMAEDGDGGWWWRMMMEDGNGGWQKIFYSTLVCKQGRPLTVVVDLWWPECTNPAPMLCTKTTTRSSCLLLLSTGDGLRLIWCSESWWVANSICYQVSPKGHSGSSSYWMNLQSWVLEHREPL